jgi:peroxiredoxin
MPNTAAFNPESPPELQTTHWIGAKEPITLKALKGRVVVLVAFQMLCPGCIEHGLPQAKRLRERFNPSEVAVIGLHTVFEHHAVMTPAALDVFQHEYKWPFPIGIDAADTDGIPKTMANYAMRGTPTLLLFDRAGRLRRHYFGKPEDMLLAAEIMAMIIEDKAAPREFSVAVERKLALGLSQSAHDHDHSHDDAHPHRHVHADGQVCDHDHSHDHAHDHGGHDHDHPPAKAEAKSKGRGKTV